MLTRSGLSHRSSEEELETVPPLPPIDDKPITAARDDPQPTVAGSKLFKELLKSLSVAKREACLQPEKTHSYQYLFAVQFFNSYVYRGRINRGYLGGLDKVFKIRDRHHRIRRQILRKDEGIISILAQS